ncbi:MAG: 30S ribosomal protein S19e [Candidatus Micrarchaeota archaeon]|nr:30S ribosomal protein S19e [Candidatus Micrarchaeota archaeon]
MVSAKDVPAGKLIESIAEDLKKIKEMKAPEWAPFVKTGVSRERVPDNKDWWYVRSSSILRKLYIQQPIGVERLRKLYGGRKNLGTMPEHKRKASGAVIRNILQQLEKAGFVGTEKGRGRILTPKGRSFVAKKIKTASTS